MICDNAKWKFHGQKGTGNIINKYQVSAAKDRTCRYQPSVINTNQCTCQMGIISPTHPINPPRQTAAALSNVEATIKIRRYLRTLIPKLLASSSSKVSRLICHRKIKIRLNPMIIGRTLQQKDLVVVLVKLPISQKVICWRTSLGSATYLIIVTPALQSDMIIVPVRTRLRVWECADFRLIR